MSHIFISYSTKNADYAYKLANVLIEKGFEVWIDNTHLRSGDNWWELIVVALQSCAAFVVVMTSEAKTSKWVQREVTLADNWGKPTFPLLLDGDNWEIYVLTQFRNVKQGTLPLDEFFDALAKKAPRKLHGADVTAKANPDITLDQDVKQAIADPPPKEEFFDISHTDNELAQTIKPTVTKTGRSRSSFGLFAAGLIVAVVLILLVLQQVSNSNNLNNEATQVAFAQFSTETALASIAISESPTTEASPTQKPTLSSTPTLTPTPSNTPTPTSTPTIVLVPTAAAAEILIVVANFQKQIDTSLAPAQIISDNLRQVVSAVEVSENVDIPVRVEAIPSILMTEDDANSVINQSSAALVIWGEVNPTGTITHYLLSKVWADQVKDCPAKSSLTGEDIPLKTGQANYERFVMNYVIGQLLSKNPDYFDQALIFLDTAINDAPSDSSLDLTNGWAHDARAAIYRNQGEYQSAIDNFKAAKALGISYACLDHFIADSFIQLKEYADGIAIFTQLIDEKIDLANSYSWRAGAYQTWANETGDTAKYQLAIDDYTEAITLEPNNAGTYRSRGSVYKVWGDKTDDVSKYQLAVDDYAEAIDLNFDPISWAYYDRGQIYKAWGDKTGDTTKYQSAIDDYSLGIEAVPDDANLYRSRASVYKAWGDKIDDGTSKYESAIADYTQAINIVPDNAGTYRSRGSVYKVWGDKTDDVSKYQLAVDDYTQAIALNFDPINYVYYERGITYEAWGNKSGDTTKYENAIDDYTQGIEATPDDANLYVARANAHYWKLGNSELALSDYNQAIEINPDYSGIYVNLGNFYFDQGNSEQALINYQLYIQKVELAAQEPPQWILDRIQELSQ